MPDFKNYDPRQYSVTFAGIIVGGFMDGTFISVERTEDSYSMAVGARGDVARVRSRDKTGTVTITLQQTSPSNDLLSAQIVADELLGTGVAPLLLKDNNGTTIIQAANAWIRRPANSEQSDELSSREWAIDCAELNMVVGGSLS